MPEKIDKRFISLFSGAMGLDLGLEMAGFETAACVDNDAKAAETVRLNRPDLPMIEKSIVDVSGDELRVAAGFGAKDEIPLLVGGPPCQAFSVFGNRKGIKDARGQLLFEFVRLVEELQPKIFVMENVRGLLSMSVVPRSKNKEPDFDTDPELLEHGSLLRLVARKLNEIGYDVDTFVVNSVNYGAPQIRERLIIIGNRAGLSANFLGPQFSNRPEDGLPPFKTLGDAIGPDSDFVDPCPEVMNFSERKLHYLSQVPPGGNWRSLPEDIQKESMGKSWYLKGGRSAYWRKLSFAFPSPTVVTMPNHAGTSMCHPTELRAITVGEAAAIQEFPAAWQFAGTTNEKFKQVGNAVPTRLGKVAGAAVLDLLQRQTSVAKNGSSRICSHNIVHLRPHVRTRTFFKQGKVFAGDHCYYDEDNAEPEQRQIALKLK